MKQFNLNMSRQLEKSLLLLMKLRNIPHKSEAIRVAIAEALERSGRGESQGDFRSLLGICLTKVAKKSSRFRSEDDLWEKD